MAHAYAEKSDTIPSDFLTKSDKEHLMSLVSDWLFSLNLSDEEIENMEEISYSITVTWKEKEHDNG